MWFLQTGLPFVGGRFFTLVESALSLSGRGSITQTQNNKEKTMSKQAIHGKTTEMYLDSGVRGAKTAAAAEANQKLADTLSFILLTAKVPAEIVNHEWFQTLLKGAAPGALHAGATYYPHLVPQAIGAHRIVMGSSMMVEAEARDIIQPLLKQLQAALAPALQTIADLAPRVSTSTHSEDSEVLTVVASEVVNG